MNTDDEIMKIPDHNNTSYASGADDTADPDNSLVPTNKLSAVSDSNQTIQPSQPALSIQVPDEAADTDLIEKEWVERAKQIVDHTRDDPHEQQRAISHMKADYMKKRYNKDIKLSAD